MYLNCKFNNKNKKLKFLKFSEEKLKGLKGVTDCDGAFFHYDHDVDKKYNFSEIDRYCLILFLDKDLNVLKKEKTVPFQEKTCGCHLPFRYVIEIFDD